MLSLKERFMLKVVKEDTGCWKWCAGSFANGYGQFSLMWQGKHQTRSAHRVAYELWVKPIPEGYQIDHLCKNLRCVNPAHLEKEEYEDDGSRTLSSWEMLRPNAATAD